MNPTDDPSTGKQKAIVSITSFCCACAAFMLGVLVLVPLSAALLNALQAPDLVQQAVAFLVLFGTPVAGALLGLHIGVRAAGITPPAAPRPPA